LLKAILEFQRRDRRFGGLTAPDADAMSRGPETSDRDIDEIAASLTTVSSK